MVHFSAVIWCTFHLLFAVVYAYFKDEDKIELIEIYYKQDKEKENRERILRYYGEKGK